MNEETRESEITRVFQKLVNVTDVLVDHISNLEKRITPVLRANTPDAKEQGVNPSELSAPFAMDLNSMVRRIETANAILLNIKNRVEL